MQEKRRGKRMAVASNTPQVVALLRGVRVGMAALLLLTLLTPGSAQSSNLKGDGAQLSLNPTVPISTFQQPILVNAPLAQKTKPPKACFSPINNKEVDPETLMPRNSGYKVAFTIESSGVRNYTCSENKTIDPYNSTSVGLFSGDFDGISYYNQYGLSTNNMTTPDGRPAGTLIVDNYNIVSFIGDNVMELPPARWPIYIIQGPLIPWTCWATRTNVTGGSPPDNSLCLRPGQQIRVPFSSLYQFWTC